MRPVVRKLGGLLAAGLVLAAGAAEAETLTLDRLLQREDLGPSALSPDGRHLIIQTEAPLSAGVRFDTVRTDLGLGRLMVADLRSAEPARPLIAQEPGAGYTAGPFSPSGRSMIINRLIDQAWEAGVVNVSTGAVHWLGHGLELPLYGRSLQWISESVFVAIVLDDGDRPLHLKLGSQNQARLQALWARQAHGKKPSLIVMGSGRARNLPLRQDRRLMRFDLATGEQTVLATGGFFDLEVSPSGRFVAALGEAEGVGLAPAPAVQLSAPTRRRDLTIVDLTTGFVRRPCASCTTLIQPLVWSPKVEKLLAFQHDARASETTGALIVIDAVTGALTALGKGLRPEFDYGGEGFATVRAEWLGSTPILFARQGGAQRADWYSLEAASPRNITALMPKSVADILVTPDEQLLGLIGGQVWHTDKQGRVGHGRANAQAWLRPSDFGAGFRGVATPRHARAPWLQTGVGVADRLGDIVALPERATAISPADYGVVVEVREQSGVDRLSFIRTGGTKRDLLVLNKDLAGLEQGVIRTIEAKSPTGATLKHWLYLPPGWRRGKPAPLIVVPYPGSSSPEVPSRFGFGSNGLTPSGPLLAAQGYAVLVPALPRERSRGEPAEGLADQILAAVDAAVNQGFADPDRLAMWGHSFGGYAALVTATQTSRFKAIIAQAAPSDYVSRWAGMYPYFATAPEDGAPNPSYLGYSESGQAALLGPLWDQTPRYLRNSPLFQADHVTTPLLIINSDQDQIALSQGQSMFNALYRQDKDATLVSLFGEGHQPRSPANIRALYDTVLPWLADRLAAPPPAVGVEPSRSSQ